ncbi:hypothetical protein [Nonomuraea sp. NPDC049684]|uniref:hypothetical protein n=1 Tax=Nonomuraea sp. NPDC049684 TaxID=3364356 RepID=UPI00379BAF1A
MSEQAVAYVRGLRLADPDVERVLVLLAERTTVECWGEEPSVMGVELDDSVDIPQLAAAAGMDAQQFRSLLRQLKTMVPMDVIEHDGGVWEIVYGPSYTNRGTNAVKSSTSAPIGGIQPFTMPGWDRYSTWGYEDGLGHFYAQLYRNSDNPDAAPRIWITPPQYVVTTVDDLAEAIATAIAPYEAVPPPAEVIKIWLKH